MSPPTETLVWGVPNSRTTTVEARVVPPNTADSAATISGLTITSGKAANGGGLYNNGGQVTITASTFSGNTAAR